MPKQAKSDIEVAQRACTMAGIVKISSFDDPDNEVAQALNDMYEDIVADCLSNHPWRFANYDVDLGPPLATRPLVKFNTAYAIPTDPPPLHIHTLYLSGSLVSKYEIKADQLHVDATPTDQPVLSALWRVNEAQWPAGFVLYVILRVAGFLTAAITRNGQLTAALGTEGERQFARARTRDSQQQTTQKLRLTKIRSTRLGGRPMA
jgi:hypothetical protein